MVHKAITGATIKGQGTYVIDENNVDHHPLMQQANISVVAPTPFSTILLVVVIAIAVATAVPVTLLLLYRQRLNKQTIESKTNYNWSE